jgi:hypothetical protein
MEKAQYQAADPGYVVSWYDRLQITLKTKISARETSIISTKPGFDLAKGRLRRLFQLGAIHKIVPVVKPNRLPY